MSLVQIKNITAGFGRNTVENPVLLDLSMELETGELVGLLGVNGCGKSTFAKAICNLLPHTGEVLVGGQSTSGLTQKQMANLISYVPQRSGIGIDISVKDVVLMGYNNRLNSFQSPDRQMEEEAEEILGQVGLQDRINTNYMLLSEGQKRLVILARALVSQGSFLVMDEPESALDFGIRHQMMSLARSWVSKEQRTGLVILHDINLALEHCNRIFLMRDKRIDSVLDLRKESMESIASMEEKLRRIYGKVQLVSIPGKMGNQRLVMVRDTEDV